MKGNWKLYLGCHEGTLMSRDTMVEEYATLDECREAAEKAEKSWNRFGYFVWYSYAIGPNSEKIKFHKGTPYACLSQRTPNTTRVRRRTT